MPIESSQYFIILFRVNQVFTFYNFIELLNLMIRKIITEGTITFLSGQNAKKVTEGKDSEKRTKRKETIDRLGKKGRRDKEGEERTARKVRKGQGKYGEERTASKGKNGQRRKDG